MKFLLLSFLGYLAFGVPAQTKPGIQPGYMDTQVKPGEDFYRFCNGNWEKEFRLAPDDAGFGSLNEVEDRNQQKIQNILKRLATNKDAASGTDQQRLRDFYLSGMDSVNLDKSGTEVLKPIIRRIETLKNTEDFIALKSDFDFMGIPLFFKLSVAPELNNRGRNLIYLRQGGYGMGDKAYYHDPANKKIAEAYMEYLKYLFLMNGFSEQESEDAAEEVYYYEKALCNEAFSREELERTEISNTPVSYDKLIILFPSINWKMYFFSEGLTPPDTVILSSIQYFSRVNWMVEKTPLPVLRLYSKAQLFQASAPYLSTKIQFNDFQFREKVSYGTEAQKPRWERVFVTMESCMGEMFSKEYVKQYFPAEAKLKAGKMVDDLVSAFSKRLATREWMNEESKATGIKKLNNMTRKIAYPDKWKTYKGLVIKKQSYWENVCSARRFEHREMLNELKNPVNRMKWQITPYTVDTYYNPGNNELIIPAGILQAPFFDPKADDAVNYGAIGAIIGHELTHGFDDKGSKFDANGNFRPWRTDQDQENFKRLSEKLLRQYEQCIVLDSLHVNGKMTLSENIADLGGITLAYQTYKATLKGSTSPTRDGYSGEQRFFIAWAQSWKSKVQDQEMKRLLRLDYHAPAHIRAVIPLSNHSAFYEAFGIKPGDKIYRPENERVEIW